MERRNMASFAVSSRLMENALTIPENHEIIGAEWDFASRTVRLYVEGPDLPEVEIGQLVPSITPLITFSTDDSGRRLHKWEWNCK